MAWIKLLANGEELDRRELCGPVVIGRSPECDVAVRDILLSRTHCRIEPCGRGGWKVVDLNSKNGTRVGWQAVQSHVLRDGDWLRMGRTRITFHIGEFEPAEYREPRKDRLVRPADPHEALTGTVTDFVLLDEEESGQEWVGPTPQPRPLEPVSFREQETQSLLEDIASSYWSLEKSSGTTTALARPRAAGRATVARKKAVYRSVTPMAVEADMQLQVDEGMLTAEPLTAPVTKKRRWAMRVMVGAAVLLCTSVMMMSLWLLTMGPVRR